MLSVKTEAGKRWKNWSETVVNRPEKILYPSSIDEVVTIVKEAAKQKKKIRVIGAGHSFSPLVKTDDWLVSLDLLSGIEKLDEDNMTVTVFAGTRLFQLGKELGERGYAQENLGDINVQSIAGAISTGTHGTGISFGNIATQVVGLVIVTGTGEVLTVSETENAHLFKACLISMGALGIIVKVKLRIIKTLIYEYVSEKVEFSKLMDELDNYIYKNRHFEFFLFPYSDLVQVKRMNIVDGNPQSLTLHRWKNLILENYIFFVASEYSRIFPKASKFISRLSAQGVGTTKIVAKSHDIFATPRLVKFREMEYSIPLKYFREAVEEVREQIETKKYEVHFPLECRVVKGDDIWLSPSYERDSAYIAFHMYKGMPYEQYFRDMEALMKKYEGRPHWGKMHFLTKKELQKLYPRLQDFFNVKNELDPHHIFWDI